MEKESPLDPGSARPVRCSTAHPPGWQRYGDEPLRHSVQAGIRKPYGAAQGARPGTVAARPRSGHSLLRQLAEVSQSSSATVLLRTRKGQKSS